MKTKRNNISLVATFQRPAIRRELKRLLSWLEESANFEPCKLTSRAWINPNEGILDWRRAGKNFVPALKEGMFIVKLDRRCGHLTIEGCAGHYGPPVKDALFTLVAQHAAHVRSVQVSLHDQNANGVVMHGGADLSGVPEEERVHHIPCLSDSPTGKAWRALWEWPAFDRMGIATLRADKGAARLLASACSF